MVVLNRALDWLVDDAMPTVLLFALLAGWLVAVVLLAITGHVWLAAAGVLLGVPFVIAVVRSRD